VVAALACCELTVPPVDDALAFAVAERLELSIDARRPRYAASVSVVPFAATAGTLKVAE
jgi:hypothetical protein